MKKHLPLFFAFAAASMALAACSKPAAPAHPNETITGMISSKEGNNIELTLGEIKTETARQAIESKAGDTTDALEEAHLDDPMQVFEANKEFMTFTVKNPDIKVEGDNGTTDGSINCLEKEKVVTVKTDSNGDPESIVIKKVDSIRY